MSRFCPGFAPEHWRRPHCIKAFGLLAIAMALSAVNPARAQSAADKATARQLATQGIQSYQQGKNTEALDLLQRAQQLYDAPVHLIYIARAQAALGKLVEAAETYRRLVRIDLPANAPQAFKDAVADAHKELPHLEPKIPSLRIDVIPADAAGIKLKLDGELLSAVVIGINRPTNPGKHALEVSANGYESASASVELAQGATKTVTLRMTAKPGALPGDEAAEPAAGGGPSSRVPSADGSVPSNPSSGELGGGKPQAPPFDRGSQIVVGVRGLVASPGGTLQLGGLDAQAVSVNGRGPDNQPITSGGVSERFGAGGGLELRLGYRLSIGRQFALTPMITFQSSWYDKGKYYSQPINTIVRDYALSAGNSSSVLQITPSQSLALLGAAIEYPIPSNAWHPSYYAELGFILVSQLQASGTLTTGTSTCKITDKFSGRGLRVGLGLLLPAAKLFRFNVGIGYSAIATTGRDYSDNCERADGSTGIEYKATFAGSDQKIHSMLSAGIGGDLLFGL